MSNGNESDEIPISVISENVHDDLIKESESSDVVQENCSDLLDAEKQKTSECEEKLKHILADFQNLSRKTQSDIENGINAKVDELNNKRAFYIQSKKDYLDFLNQIQN